MHGNPNGTDALSQGIMFPSNDRVGAAAASMILVLLRLTSWPF